MCSSILSSTNSHALGRIGGDRQTGAVDAAVVPLDARGARVVRRTAAQADARTKSVLFDDGCLIVV